MSKKKMFIVAAALILCLALAGVLAACAGSDGVGVKSIEKTGSEGSTDIYTVYYTDGTTTTFEVQNGTDGADGESVSAQDIYEQYKLATGDTLTYEEFIDKYLDVTVAQDNSEVISSVLRSTAAVYTEFYETQSSFPMGGSLSGTAVYTGSAVIYKIEGDHTWFITNYHVVYSENANEDNLTYSRSGADDQHIARRIILYLYGSEGTPAKKSGETNDYTAYDYGKYAIECEYAGGSEQNDLALLKAKTADVKAINSDVCEVSFAEGYDVGDTAIVIGNTGGDGISVTEGIVSVHSENIYLEISGEKTVHRSMRVDAAMYGGNSGGGCFNVYGQLIGVLGIDLALTNLTETIGKMRLGDSGRFILIEHTGRLICSPQTPDLVGKVIGKDFRHEALERLQNSPDGLYRITIGNTDVMAMSITTPFGWKMAFVEDVAEIFSSADEAMFTIAVVSLLITLVMIALGLVLVRTITRPLDLLVGYANEVAAGKLEASVDAGHFFGELARLHQALEDMLNNLRKFISESRQQTEEAKRQTDIAKKAVEEAEEALTAWVNWARHCRIPAFVELQRKIVRHWNAIINTIEYGLTNARIEAINNKIKLSIRMAYGFRNIENMIAMIMLRCSDIKVQLPWEQEEWISFFCI